MKRLLTLFWLSVLITMPLLAQHEPPAFIKDSLDTYVKRAIGRWQIPGAAVAIVKDGQVVVAKGYGVRELGGREAVDANTLFMIGSNTKAFTATALAMLEQDKKLSLDDAVIRWLPDFRLYDPWVTREATVRDLLSHRLGFETFQGDFMYFDSDLSAQQVREKFGQVKPLYSFRSRWGYTNAAFLTAGEIIPRADGRSWAAFMRERIFQPLGMRNTLALSTEITAASNKGAAHTIVHGQLRKIPYGNIDALAPAGSIVSSANDLVRWVTALLDEGKHDGKEVIPPMAIRETRTPQSIQGNGGHMYNKSHFSLYGLGWGLSEYAGRKVVSHTGGVNGFVTSVCLIPEEKLGIIVLTNTDANWLYEALRNEIEDAYLGLPYRGYERVFHEYYEKQQAEGEALHRARMDTVSRHPSMPLPLSAFVGDYRDAVYGAMTIRLEQNKLIARFEHHKGRHAVLEPLGNNRFLATFNDPLYGENVWPFVLSGGVVKSITVRVSDFVEFTPYEFVKN
ncbi:MAG: serine hydrolase [Cyclobacteriaceae bacterium]|nr:serine hydrolase [Cyclobacteriaceae bacterium]